MFSSVQPEGSSSTRYNGPFQLLFGANVLANISISVNIMTIAWCLTNNTRSIASVALVQSTQSLPLALLCIPFGVVADIVERRMLLILAQGLAIVASLVLVTILAITTPPTWSFLLISTIIGSSVALSYPSWQASIGDLVEGADLPAAVSANAIIFNIARIVGPALAGLLISLIGAAGTIAVSCGGFMIFLVVLFRWTPTAKEVPTKVTTFWETLKIGFVFSWHHITIRRALFETLIFGFIACIASALLPAVIKFSANGSSWSFGIVTSCFGCGAVCGGLIAASWRRHMVAKHFVLAGAFSGIGLCAVLFAIASNAQVAAIAAFAGGISWVSGFVYLNTTIHVTAPRPLIGRTLAMYQTVNAGSLAIGSWAWGALSDAVGFTTAVLGAAALSCLVSGVYFYQAIRNHAMFRPPLDRQ
ncbi:MFS transporter [Bradyrhizobium sp. sBnM-33]|uniref:MFS transporter n=1 Tax=Bradyrhizobium sp. sBnM-33 TaxID=2831780 RepID=UPI001BCD6F41|nr:MFS transporter [Bradyrhizobium sp. sBnM-33]WOH52592.1 MFS transporter [Bradyrhizobium sp. sBnM-33]